MSDHGFSDSATFELADVALAADLAERLAPRWKVAVKAEGNDAVVVGAELRADPDDVAILLREVEAFVAEESLCALRFELDQRGYVLEAGEADWENNFAAAVGEGSEKRRAHLLKALGSVDRALLALGGAKAPAPRVQGLEALREDISFALRLEEESS